MGSVRWCSSSRHRGKRRTRRARFSAPVRAGIFAAHGASQHAQQCAGTYKDTADKYFWHKMEVDIKQCVSECVACQLAKGTQPSRQGYLAGNTFHSSMSMVCMDLMGLLLGCACRLTKDEEVLSSPFIFLLSWTHFLTGSGWKPFPTSEPKLFMKYSCGASF